MFGLGKLGRMGGGGLRTLAQKVRSLFSRLSPNGHMYIGGAGGVVKNGFQPGNYVESAGATLASTDGPVGLVKDAAGDGTTGINASQPTAGYKPMLRRGIVNLLTYSNAFSNAAWLVQGTASKSGNDLLTPASGDRVIAGATVSSGAITVVFVLSGTGTASIYAFNATDGNIGIRQITLTSEPTLYVTTATATIANTNALFARRTGDTATSITFGGGALFQGTLTSAQILAYGGIPLTTTAAASSSLGPQYLEFLASANRYLSLGAVPFQMSDDWCVSVVARCDSAALSNPAVFVLGNASNANPLVSVDFATGGFPRGVVRDDAGVAYFFQGATAYVLTNVLFSLWKHSGVIELRVNGVQVLTSGYALTTTTLTTAGIGYRPSTTNSNHLTGNIYAVLPEKGTLTLAEVQLLEAQAARCANGRLVNGAFVSDF